MNSFLLELKRRNVLRVAAAYALVAWIIIEAGSVLLPTFGASESAFQTYVIIVLAGFIVSLVLAWVFEVTPDGVKLEKNVDRSASVDPNTGQAMFESADIVRYLEQAYARPADSTSRFSPTDSSPTPNLFIDLAGRYVIELMVYDQQSTPSCGDERVALKEGDKVKFEVVQGDRGPKAEQVEKV